MEVYLDNCATTRPRKEVVEEINYMLYEVYGNPSSLHRKGFEAEKKVENARNIISTFLGVRDNEIYFTSSGTESNNMAIQGIVEKLSKRGNHIITTKIEHPSVLNIVKCYETNGYDVTYLDVDEWGYVDLNQLEESVSNRTILVAVMLVNNEVGIIQPINKIREIISKKNKITKLHVDGVQALGKISLDLKSIQCDTFSFSGHKIHGPKGIGGLYVKKGLILTPIVFGGNQEFGLRSGTENTPGIVGFGKAVELISNNYRQESKNILELKNYFISRLKNEINDIKVNSHLHNESVPHILNVSFLNIKGEVLLHYLEEHGIYVSTGSACSSNNKSKGKSKTLEAIGLSDNEIEGAIRFSFSFSNTKEQIDYTIDKLKISVNEIRKITMR